MFFWQSFFFANQWNMWCTYTLLLKPDQISHTQSMVAKRGLTNRANIHTPMWKMWIYHQFYSELITTIAIFTQCHRKQYPFHHAPLLTLGWTKKNLLERDLNLRHPDRRARALPTDLTSPILAVSLFCQYLCSGPPVTSHETIYCPLARDHAQVTIQPGNRLQGDAP